MSKKKKNPNRKSHLRLLHQYYTYTGFYSFLGRSLIKAAPPILIFIAVLLGIHFFVIDVNTMLIYITENFPPIAVFAIFFASESILGLIPPEIFIAWCGKASSPWFFLFILSFLSYLGGIISYFVGRGIASIPSVFVYLEVKMAKHIKNMRKWGGILILAGALLPLPFAIASISAGIIKFPFGSYLLFGLLRFVRFAIYGALIFGAL
ncbi:YqaA family protein [Psychroflexus montanilacus]|uniref:YqaA family protein n=1 Tax=Psychroflexus montanilacus TaxID=2873598 RepID=UPI001CCBA4E6|nr:short-chain dehydrogenase [Psychroflexus montanilacus]MBZ9650507.1 short-chain dehydrogenase [Psychroflexus montanilacus]